MDDLEIRPDDALIVADPQNDFCPGGALAVAGGDEIMPGINALAEKFALVVLTQDWHPPDHISFASNHPGAEPYQMIETSYGMQVLWPDHCVQGTHGADFHPAVVDGALRRAHLVIRKGYHRGIDSYSAFYENDRTTATGLAGYLREKGARRCVFVGLAYDFCVAYSALDAVREEFGALVVKPLTRAIAIDEEGRRSDRIAEAAFRDSGVRVAA